MPVAAWLRRVPFTITMTLFILVLALATRGLISPMKSSTLGSSWAYGLPAFQDGRPWTLVTGSLFAMEPAEYIPILFGALALSGFAELCLGTRKAALSVVACQVIGVIGAAALLVVIRDHGYAWATGLARQVDAGPSAGFLGAAAMATATLRPPWRGRARVLLGMYVFLSAVHLGSLADVEHAVAVSAGLLLGPVLLGRRPRLSLHALTRHEYRLLASGFFVLTAVENLFQPFAPGTGPLTSTLSESARARTLENADNWVATLIQAGVWFWFAWSLAKGRRRTWWWACAVLTVVMVIQLLGMAGLAVGHEPGWPVAIYHLLGNLAGLTILILGRRAFGNPSRRRARHTRGALVATVVEDQRDSATELLQEEGTVNNLAWLTTWPENRWFTTSRCSGYVAYQVHAGVALGLCDPVAAEPEGRTALLTAFSDRAHQDGLVPCLFSVTQESAYQARVRGWQALEVAEEAVIDLPSLEFRGKPWQDVRTALNQGARLGITYRLGPLLDQPRWIQAQVRAISSEWVHERGLPEMGFTLGGVDEALDPQVRVGVAVDQDSTVQGFTSWMPVHRGAGEPVGWTLDVMRRRPGGFRYSMEFLISSACLAFKDEGCQLVSLSGAPLAKAGAGGSAMDRGPLDGFLDRLGGSLEPYYGFRSLLAFKAKFQPRFEPLFLVFPDEVALPRIGLALSRAYLPEAGLRDFVALARHPSSGSRSTSAKR